MILNANKIQESLRRQLNMQEGDALHFPDAPDGANVDYSVPRGVISCMWREGDLIKVMEYKHKVTEK